MTDNIISREEFINLLDEIIEDEMQKPLNEIDMEIVTACEHLINALMGNEHEYTDEDAEKYFAEITRKHREKKNPFFIRSKRILAASVAVFIIFFGGIAFCAFNPTVKDMILNVLELNVGDSVYDNGITYIYMGQSRNYNSIEELVLVENLNILYPRELPDNVSVKSIYITENRDETTITYTDYSIGIIITHNYESTKLPIDSEYFINNIKYSIIEKEDCYMAYAIINQDLYSIRSNNEETLYQLIKSLE